MALYNPHQSVMDHPEITQDLLALLMRRSPEEVGPIVKVWKDMKNDSHIGKSFTMAIDWDLRTHYGMSDAELGPPL